MINKDFLKRFFEKWGYVIFAPLIYMTCYIALTYLGKAFGIKEQSAIISILLLPFICFLYYKKKYKKKKFKLTKKSLLIFFQLIFIAICLSLASTFMSGVSNKCKISVLNILGFAFAGPINEEIIYRGFVFEKSKKFMGVIPALLLSSLLFGVAHEGVLNIIISFLGGIIFCLIYLRYNSLIAAIFSHVVVNLLSFWPLINSLPIGIYILGVSGLLIFAGTLIYNRIKSKGE